MMHDLAWHSLAGHYLERADSTARILDVKYHLLLPRGEGGRRHRLLSMECVAAFVSAFEIIARVSRFDYARRVAELLRAA